MTRDKLDAETVAERLKSFPGWCLDGGTLRRVFEFESFQEAFAFMTQGALISERLNHHPSWVNEYRTVDIRLSSHDIQGISERDFKWLQAITAAYSTSPN